MPQLKALLSHGSTTTCSSGSFPSPPCSGCQAMYHWYLANRQLSAPNYCSQNKPSCQPILLFICSWSQGVFCLSWTSIPFIHSIHRTLQSLLSHQCHGLCPRTIALLAPNGVSHCQGYIIVIVFKWLLHKWPRAKFNGWLFLRAFSYSLQSNSFVSPVLFHFFPLLLSWMVFPKNRLQTDGLFSPSLLLFLQAKFYSYISW